MGKRFVMLPATFAMDRVSRDLPIGTWHSSGTRITSYIDCGTLADLIDDAKHYASPHGPDEAPRSVVRSAKATLASLKRQGVAA